MVPPRKQSEAKKHFKNNDAVSKTCRHCKQQVKISGNTSNLIKHLMRKHPAILMSEFTLDETSNTSQNFVQ